MTTYNYHAEAQRVVYREYDKATSIIKTQYELFENLLDGKINSITISLKSIIRNVVYLYIIRKDILSLPTSASDFFDDSWELLAKKYNSEIKLKEFLPQMRTDIGELLYSYLFKIYNAFSCENFTCTRDLTKGYESYHISAGNIVEMGGGLQNIFNDLRRLLNALELLLKVEIITPNTRWGLPIKDFPSVKSIYANQLSVKQNQDFSKIEYDKMKTKLNKYKVGLVDYSSPVKETLSVNYQNDYLSFDGYRTSNSKGNTSKMWSLLFFPKKDFQQLKGYIELGKITRIKTTKVKDNISGRWAIRLYDMHKNPDESIIISILNYIFKE